MGGSQRASTPPLSKPLVKVPPTSTTERGQSGSQALVYEVSGAQGGPQVWSTPQAGRGGWSGVCPDTNAVSPVVLSPPYSSASRTLGFAHSRARR